MIKIRAHKSPFRKHVSFLNIFSLILFLGSCKAKDIVAAFSLPTVEISCSGADHCADNTADDAGGRVVVYWTTEDVCPTSLGEAAASAEISCVGGTCTASISTWFNVSADGQSGDITSTVVTELDEGTYHLCGFIDSDDDGIAEAGEPLQLKQNIIVEDGESLGEQIMESWSNIE